MCIAPATEKRLKKYAKAAREAYNDGVIYDIIWIRSKYNRANAMKKGAILATFLTAIEKIQLHYEVE